MHAFLSCALQTPILEWRRGYDAILHKKLLTRSEFCFMVFESDSNSQLFAVSSKSSRFYLHHSALSTLRQPRSLAMCQKEDLLVPIGGSYESQ